MKNVKHSRMAQGAARQRPRSRKTFVGNAQIEYNLTRAAALGGPPTGAADRGDRNALSRLFGRQPPSVGSIAAHSAGRVPVVWAARVLLTAGGSGRYARH